jgi:hypothetical protein
VSVQSTLHPLSTVSTTQRRGCLSQPTIEQFNGEKIGTFLFSIESSFAYYEVTEGNKIREAARYFKDAALIWYQYLVNDAIGSMNWETERADVKLFKNDRGNAGTLQRKRNETKDKSVHTQLCYSSRELKRNEQ